MPYSDTPEARYQRESAFRALVDTLHALISRADYSPSEIREASMLACIHHEMITPRHRVVYVGRNGEASFTL